MSLATSSPRHNINKNVPVGAIMLPRTNSNEQFQMHYSVGMFFNPMVTRAILKYCMICFELNVTYYKQDLHKLLHGRQ